MYRYTSQWIVSTSTFMQYPLEKPIQFYIECVYEHCIHNLVQQKLCVTNWFCFFFILLHSNRKPSLIYLIRNDKVHKPMILVHSWENNKKNKTHKTLTKKRKKTNNSDLFFFLLLSNKLHRELRALFSCIMKSFETLNYGSTVPQFINCWLCRLLATYLKIDAFRHCQVQFNHNS